MSSYIVCLPFIYHVTNNNHTISFLLGLIGKDDFDVFGVVGDVEDAGDAEDVEDAEDAEDADKYILEKMGASPHDKNDVDNSEALDMKDIRSQDEDLLSDDQQFDGAEDLSKDGK